MNEGIYNNYNNDIDPTAIIPDTIGNGNHIGAYAVIEDNVTLGDNNWIGPLVTIGQPGEYRNKNIRGTVIIGNNNIIREHTAIQASVIAEATRIGNDNYIMEKCHIAHDCVIDNGVTIAPLTSLGGSSRVKDNATLGQGVIVHPRLTIGEASMVGMNTTVTKDIPGYEVWVGSPAKYHRPNYKRIMEKFKKVLPIHPVYRLITTGETDIDLGRLLKKATKLTLDPFLRCGFREIELLSLKKKVDKDHQHFLESMEKTYTDFGVLIHDMKEVLKAILYEILITPEKKIFSTSAGMDSRILAWTAKELEKQYGEWITSNVVFVCKHPEGELFKRAMQHMGWNREQYHVHREDQPQSGDYYDYGDFKNVNAFAPAMFNYWSEVAPNEKECSFISGSFCGEVLSYPLYEDLYIRKGKLLDNRMQYIEKFENAYSLNGFVNTLWKNVYMPYLDYRYLDIVLRIDEKLYQFVDPTKRQRKTGMDVFRKAILDSYGDLPEYHVGHTYNFTLSERRKQYIEEQWYKSRFYKDFKDHPAVERCNPAADRGSLDSKLYGLATCYE